MVFKSLKKEEVAQPQRVEVKETPREVFEVVMKIPTQEIRRVQREDGVIVNYITVEEFQLQKMTTEANA